MCIRDSRQAVALVKEGYSISMAHNVLTEKAVDNENPFVHTMLPAAGGFHMDCLLYTSLVLKDKVIIGIAGAEYGIRGFLDAYDVKTGARSWRFYTVPAPGEPGNETWAGDSWKTGGAPTWVTGAYDPEANLVYWGTGNPSPDMIGDERNGDNLYSDALITLDADTGKLKWHFQFTPHDTLDMDANQVPVLVDADFRGRPRKLVLFANRNGFYYVLDRLTGEYLVGKQFARQNWAMGLDPHGRPIWNPAAVPSFEGALVYPDDDGTANWFSPSLDLKTGLLYQNRCV